MARQKRRRFTPVYKAEAERLVRDSGRRSPAVSRELDLTETRLRNWMAEGQSKSITLKSEFPGAIWQDLLFIHPTIGIPALIIDAGTGANRELSEPVYVELTPHTAHAPEEGSACH